MLRARGRRTASTSPSVTVAGNPYNDMLVTRKIITPDWILAIDITL
jgi:hypothetical protein